MGNYVSVKKDKVLHTVKSMDLKDIKLSEKKAVIRKHRISDSIYMKFRSRQNKSVVMKAEW